MCSVMSSVLQSSVQTQEDQVTALMEDERRRQQELLQVSISHMIAYCAFKSPDVHDVMWIFKALSLSADHMIFITSLIACRVCCRTLRSDQKLPRGLWECF